MGYFKSRGLRGSTLEEIINMTNALYEKKEIALIKKVPTPIKPIKIDKKKRTIKLAYFEQKSTVDYMGIAQGIPIAFDAKKTAKKSLPITNIHEHQIDYMKKFQDQGGIAFLLVYFSKQDLYKFIPFKTLKDYYDNSKKGGRKSIPCSEIDERYIIKNKKGQYLNYLECVNEYLREVDKK